MSDAHPTRLIRLPEVLRRLGVGRTLLYQLVSEGRLPRPVKITPRLSAWLEADVEAFIQRIAESRGDGAAGGRR